MKRSFNSSEKMIFAAWLDSHIKIQKDWRTVTKEFADFFANLTLYQLYDRVCFVENTEYCPFSLIISFEEINHIKFESFYYDILFSDTIKPIIERLRENKEETLYIEINFPQAKDNELLQMFLEKNPHETEIKQITDGLLLVGMLQLREQYLLEQIDLALSKNDKEGFTRLTNSLNELKNSKENHPII